MQLTFDSIQELEQFVLFAGHLGKQFAAAERAFESAASPLQASSVSPVGPTELGTSEAHVTGHDSSEVPAVQDSVERPQETSVAKRKRRTKAEMAEEALFADALTVRSGPITTVSQADVTEDVRQLSADAVTHSEGDEEANVRARGAELLAQPDAINSIAHLRACQDFIKRFGLPEYSKGFSDTFGLSSNVMAYEDVDRAHHLAVLEYLESRLAVMAVN